VDVDLPIIFGRHRRVLASVLMILLEPWRVFFPSALLLAPFNVLLWMAARDGLVTVPGIDSAAWHGREMLFGYGFAVMAGYLLKPMPPAALLLLWLLWLGGRLTWLLPPATPPGVEFVVGAAFPIILAVAGVRRFAVIKRLSNLGFPIVLAALGLAALGAYAAQAGWATPPRRSPAVLSVYVVAALIMIMSGRLAPTITVGVLREAGILARIPPRPLLEVATVAGMLALALLDGFGLQRAAGLVALGVATILLVQSCRWTTLFVLRDPEAWPLHLGFFWLAAGCALIGVERLGLIHPPDSGALHALAAGGIGSVTLVMMVRVTRYRAGARPGSTAWLQACQAVMAVAVMLRVGGGWAMPAWRDLMLWLSAAAWTTAYAGTAVLLMPLALKPARLPAPLSDSSLRIG
jgi:uncharacterized protein involved in response to NO